jgi:hypothetical protein
MHVKVSDEFEQSKFIFTKPFSSVSRVEVNIEERKELTIIVGEIYSKKVMVTEEWLHHAWLKEFLCLGTPSLVGLIEATAHEALKVNLSLDRRVLG